jgi:DNA-binding NtrC family response regulator
MAKYGEETGKAIRKVSPEVIEAFMRYDWPGNVRELRNVIERAVVLSNGNTLQAGDIPEAVLQPSSEGQRAKDTSTGSNRLENSEIELIRKMLAQNDWNITAAARALGTTRNTLRYRMSKHGISKPANG